MKKWMACALLLCVFWGLTACGQKTIGDGHIEDWIAGKSYVYEKDGFGGRFRIEINDDGTFEYYEGFLSSYIGTGDWALDGDILILSDDADAGYSLINRFRVERDALIFISGESSNFIYVKVADGERFLCSAEDA